MILANEKLVRTMSSTAMIAYKPTSRDLSARCPIGLLPNRRPLAQNRAHVALFATMSQGYRNSKKLLYKRITAQEESDSTMKGLGFLERKN
jgi:hypothetical protein